MKKLLKGLIIAALAALSIMAALDFGWRTEKESQDALMALSGSALCGRIEEITEDYIIEPVKEEADLPPAYDYRENGRSVPVRDQGQYGTCWAFASLTALETSLMPDALYDFSRDHLNFHNHYQMETEEGGSYILSVSYLTAWEGPVLEEDDPYGDNASPDGLEPVLHVQEVRMPGNRDFEAIKQTVYLHGGVESSLYMDFSNPGQDSAYYDRRNASYCYTGGAESNHDVVIIGWDDNYPAENFKERPEGDGAFICQNSWGTGFGDHGVFYVSYYDANIGSYNAAYTKTEDSSNYDVLYQSDLLGWCGQLGYNSELAYFANVYEAEEDLQLRAAGFYATGEDTEYRLAVIPDFEDVQELSEAQFTQSGYFQYAGYYTVEFDDSVSVKAGERFAVLVQIMTPESQYPIAVEFASGELEDKVALDDGEGYISSDKGMMWERVETAQNSNLCLKVYADREEAQ